MLQKVREAKQAEGVAVLITVKNMFYLENIERSEQVLKEARELTKRILREEHSNQREHCLKSLRPGCTRPIQTTERKLCLCDGC